MRNLILSGLATIALATVPALAQETDNDSSAGAPADQAAPQPQSADAANAEAVPAPASISTGPSVVSTASFCGGLSPSSHAGASSAVFAGAGRAVSLTVNS